MGVKRVLINASMLTKQPTGVGVYSLELLKSLIPKLDKGFIQYDIFTYEKRELLKLTKPAHIQTISLGIFIDDWLYKIVSVHRLLWNIFKLNKLSKNYDLVYSLSTHGSLFNKNQIITVHDLIALSFPKQHKFQYLYFKIIVPVILRNSKSIIAISNFTKNEILKKYKSIVSEKIDVVYNGVDHLSDKACEASDNKVQEITKGINFCLIIGASYPHKNCGTVLKVAKLIQLNKNIKFIIVGRPSKYYERLKMTAINQEIKNIIFFDYVNENLLSSLYRKATLHLYISLYEGFGFPPAEAAFYKTNSLISTQPALLELYSEHFNKVDPLNIEEIANYIMSIQKEELESDVYKHLISKYNWNNAAQNVFMILTNN